MDILDQLIQETKDLTRAKKSGGKNLPKDPRRRAFTQKMLDLEQAEHEKRLAARRQLYATLNLPATALVLLKEQTTCACGATFIHPAANNFLLRRENPKARLVWETVLPPSGTQQYSHLPIQTRVLRTRVHRCPKCAFASPRLALGPAIRMKIYV